MRIGVEREAREGRGKRQENQRKRYQEQQQLTIKA
jgi:hypothetical protein